MQKRSTSKKNHPVQTSTAVSPVTLPVTKAGRTKTGAATGPVVSTAPGIPFPVESGVVLLQGVTTSATSQPSATTSTPAPTATGSTPASASGNTSGGDGAAASTGASASALPATVADAPPNVLVPTVPSDFTPPDMSAFRGHYPNAGELGVAPKAITNLRAFVDYASLLSGSIVPAATVADTLSNGLQWRTLRDASEEWSEYVRAQDAMTWLSAMTYLDEVRPVFKLAVSKNPELATMYPALTQLLGAVKVVAKKAMVTKKKKAQAKAVTTASANAAAQAAAIVTAVAAVKAEAAVTTPAPKAVTVNT